MEDIEFDKIKMTNNLTSNSAKNSVSISTDSSNM